MAVQTWESGVCTVTFDDVTGAVTVSGQGSMEDYKTNGVPWENAKPLFKSISIQDGVTHIGDCTFTYCSGFTGDLTIPNSVTSIGYGVFLGCGFTGHLTISDSITRIGESAFADCYNFTGPLIIPDGVTYIGDRSFNANFGFTGHLTIPNSVIYIGEDAFANCSGFTGTLTIPNSVTSLGNGAFRGCGFTGHLTIPNSITRIENNAFANCSGFTGTLTIPNSVASIDYNAFNGCSNIKTIKNYAKSQMCNWSAFEDMTSLLHGYGYPENTSFMNCVGDLWNDIRSLPSIVTIVNKNGGDLYPRTKATAVHLENNKTVEHALGGLSFWRGTQSEYDALSPKPDQTVYCIIGGSVIVT